jgi:hypothetical protein
MVDKEKAVKLRLQGLSYKEISEHLGCSEAWCKVNLKCVVKNTEETEKLKQCITLSHRYEAVTSSEILKTFLTQEHYKMTKSDLEKHKKSVLRKVKDKVADNNGIVRPAWMSPNLPSESFQDLLQIVNLIDERLYEEIQEFKEKYKLYDCSESSVVMAIANLSQIGSVINGESVVRSACESYTSTANKLEERNKGKPVKYKEREFKLVRPPGFDDPSYFADLSDMEDQMY